MAAYLDPEIDLWTMNAVTVNFILPQMIPLVYPNILACAVNYMDILLISQ